MGGPKAPLLPAEARAVQAYLAGGGNGFFMLDPFVQTGLEPVIREYGVVVDDNIVIDDYIQGIKHAAWVFHRFGDSSIASSVLATA